MFFLQTFLEMQNLHPGNSRILKESVVAYISLETVMAETKNEKMN